LVKWFLVNFGFWLPGFDRQCFKITFDSDEQVKGFLEELVQLVLLPFATTQQKDCRISPAVFILGYPVLKTQGSTFEIKNGGSRPPPFKDHSKYCVSLCQKKFLNSVFK